MSYQSGEGPLLDGEDEWALEFNGSEKARAEAIKREAELDNARGTVQKLEEGLASWVTANKQVRS